MMIPHKTARKTFILWILVLIVAFASATPAFGASVPADSTASGPEAQLTTPSGPVVYQKGFTSSSPASEYDEGITVRTAVEEPLSPGWHTIGGKTYYIDQYGDPVIGPRKISGKWYFFDINGVQQKRTGWVTLRGGKWYLKNGILQVGLHKIKGSLYYFTKVHDTVSLEDGTPVQTYGQMCDCGLYKKYIISYTGKLYKLPKKSKDKKCKKIARLVARCCGKNAKGMSDLEKVSRASMVINEFYGRCHYSMKAKNYNKPYGLFYSKKCSCAGTASALKLVLTKMGFKKVKHTNKGKYKHQWCVLKMDGKKGWADGMIGWAGYGKYLNDPRVYGVYPFF